MKNKLQIIFIICILVPLGMITISFLKVNTINKNQDYLRIGVTQGMPTMIFNEILKEYDNEDIAFHEVSESDFIIEDSNIDLYGFEDC